MIIQACGRSHRAQVAADAGRGGFQVGPEIIGTGFAYVLNYQIITSEGATIASTVTYLLPVVAIVLGVLVLGESVTGIVLGGIALVLAGVALTRVALNQLSVSSTSGTPWQRKVRPS